MNEVEYIEQLLKPLLSHPDEMKVDKVVDDRGILLNVTLSGSDIGKCIGKGGEMAKCIRRILHAVGSKYDTILSLKMSAPNCASHVSQGNNHD